MVATKNRTTLTLRHSYTRIHTHTLIHTLVVVCSFSLIVNLARLNWLSRLICIVPRCYPIYSPYRLVAKGVVAARRGGEGPSLIVGHAVTRIGLYIVLQKTLASNDTRLRMMTGTTMTLGTLAQ